jgi:hypothetical protein
MTKTVDAIWDYFLLIWMERNSKLYGKDYDKQQAIALETTRAKAKQKFMRDQNIMSTMQKVLFYMPGLSSRS